jgi:hypothetical protein
MYWGCKMETKTEVKTEACKAEEIVFGNGRNRKWTVSKDADIANLKVVSLKGNGINASDVIRACINQGTNDMQSIINKVATYFAKSKMTHFKNGYEVTDEKMVRHTLFYIKYLKTLDLKTQNGAKVVLIQNDKGILKFEKEILVDASKTKKQ